MSDSRSERRRDLFAGFLLVIIVTIIFSDVLFGSGRFYIRDLSRFYTPTRSIVRSIVLSGEFPWWNPHSSGGQPMAANPEYEVFYPPGWLAFLPDYDLGFRLHILVHFYIAILGAFALLRSLRVSRAGAVFGAVSLALGGCFMSLINLLPILFCAAWMPLFFLFARRYLARPNRRDFALAALVGGLQALAGEPTTLIQTWLLLGAWALWRAVRRPRRGLRLMRAAVLLALLLGGTVAVGSVQLIPGIDHAADSSRGRGFSFEMVGGWSMHPARLAEILTPQMFGVIGHERQTVYWGASRLYPAQGAPFLFSIYFGLIAAVLLPAGFARVGAGRIFVGSVAAVSLVLSFGAHTPLYRWLYDARVVSSIRYPEKWSLSAIFVLTLFAAIVFDRCARGDRDALRIALLAAVGIAGLTIIVAGACETLAYPALFSAVWNVAPSSAGWTGAAKLKLDLSRSVWMIAAARAVIVVALLAWRFRARQATVWAGVAVALCVFDFGWLGMDISPRMPRQYFSRPPIIDGLPADRDRYRVFHEVDWYSRSKVAAEYFGTEDAVYWIIRNGMYPMTGGRWGVRTVLERDYDRTALLPTVDLVSAMWKLRDSGRSDWAQVFMNMSNAWYRSRYRDFEEERSRVHGDMKKAVPVDLLRETSAPRYYFAEEVVPIRDVDDFVHRLATENHGPRAAFVRGPGFAPSAGSVEAVEEHSSSVLIDAKAEGKALLVMSVTAHKYWSATVDGVPTELRSVNIGYQGIVLGAGRHSIQMKYRNRIIPPAAVLSVLAVALLAALAVAGRRRVKTC